MTQSLLFVDIDGVLNPYGRRGVPEGFSGHWLFPGDGIPIRVSDALGPALRLGPGRSWTVEDRAVLTTVLDLPEFLAAVDLPTGQFDPALKVPAVDRVAGDRPLAWVDDIVTAEAETCRAGETILDVAGSGSSAVGLERSRWTSCSSGRGRMLPGWGERTDITWRCTGVR